MPRFEKSSDYLVSGAIYGAAAWSAYAVVEFVFSSVLFRVTRPYSGFTAWHWKLTGLLMIGFLQWVRCWAHWRVFWSGF